MKKMFAATLVIATMMFGIAGAAQAELIVDGTVLYNGANRKLIYDTDRDITWLDYSNGPDTWTAQKAWAAGLSFTINGNVFDNWRLPATIDDSLINGGISGTFDGSMSAGWNNTTSEMGHLYYTELGNKGYADTAGNFPQAGYGLNNVWPFENLVRAWHFSDTVYAYTPDYAWFFSWGYGSQDATIISDNTCRGLAVLPGRITQPPPPPMACLFDAQCGTGEYCQKPDATCNGVGACQPRATDTFQCLDLVDPVCGCDGKDYANACEAQRLSVGVAAKGQCATTSYKWPYYFPSVKDNDAIGWENYLSVQAKDPVPMEVTIRVYDLAGNLAGTFIYSDTDPAAKAKAIAPNARVAQRPSLIAGGAIEGSIIVETSVPAIATTNCIASYYKGFSIYEAAKVKPIHYFPKAYDGPDFYQVYIVVQNIFPEPRKVTAVLSGKTTTSPGHGANQTTTIPAYGTWKFRPSDIAGGINFDGSVSVFSDLTTPRDGLGPAIPAMCRYEAGTDALAIYESAARQPQLFFPVLKDGKFGTTLDYQNYISVVNMNTQAAAVTVLLYNKSGAEEGRLADTIPSGGKKTWRPSTIKGTGAAPADFDGLVVISSDLILIGQTNTIYPGTNKYGADAFDLFESAMRNKTLFFPKAYDNLLGSGTGETHLLDNYVYVSNPDGNTKNLKIEQFNNNGTANGVATVELPPYATHVYRPKNLVTDNSGVFRGSVKVTEQSGLSITGAIKYEIHKTTDAGSGIEAMTIYRSMGQ